MDAALVREARFTATHRYGIAVVGARHGGDLDELVPESRDRRMLPSTESSPRWIYDGLCAEVRFPPRLRRVHENDAS